MIGNRYHVQEELGEGGMGMVFLGVAAADEAEVTTMDFVDLMADLRAIFGVE